MVIACDFGRSATPDHLLLYYIDKRPRSSSSVLKQIRPRSGGTNGTTILPGSRNKASLVPKIFGNTLGCEKSTVIFGIGGT